MRKQILSLVLALAVLCAAGGAAFASAEPSAEPDAYTSASATRTVLTGSALDAAAEELMGLSSDLATAAEVKAPGYTKASSIPALILSVNTDGCPGMSSIEAWKLTRDDDGLLVTVVMTDGQNVRGLKNIGDKATLIVHGSQYYILHLETVDADCLEYSDEAYAAGQFNNAYSGAPEQRCEYTVTLRVTAAEGTQVYLFV